jgi:hypothetical protein
MYGKVPRSFFLFYIDHIVVAIFRFVELQPRQLKGSAGQVPVGKMASGSKVGPGVHI